MKSIIQRNREIKKLLIKRFGKNNVWCRAGKGTGSHWVHVEVRINKEMTRPEECELEDDIERYITKHIEVDTYADDMGMKDHNCVIIRVLSAGIPF